MTDEPRHAVHDLSGKGRDGERRHRGRAANRRSVRCRHRRAESQRLDGLRDQRRQTRRHAVERRAQDMRMFHGEAGVTDRGRRPVAHRRDDRQGGRRPIDERCEETGLAAMPVEEKAHGRRRAVGHGARQVDREIAGVGIRAIVVVRCGVRRERGARGAVREPLEVEQPVHRAGCGHRRVADDAHAVPGGRQASRDLSHIGADGVRRANVDRFRIGDARRRRVTLRRHRPAGIED